MGKLPRVVLNFYTYIKNNTHSTHYKGRPPWPSSKQLIVCPSSTQNRTKTQYMTHQNQKIMTATKDRVDVHFGQEETRPVFGVMGHIDTTVDPTNTRNWTKPILLQKIEESSYVSYLSQRRRCNCQRWYLPTSQMVVEVRNHITSDQ